jgi:hypothetical protein
VKTSDLTPRGTQVIVTLGRRLTDPPGPPSSPLQRAIGAVLVLPVVAIALVLVALLFLLLLVSSLTLTALLAIAALLVRRR